MKTEKRKQQKKEEVKKTTTATVKFDTAADSRKLEEAEAEALARLILFCYQRWNGQ